MFIAFITLVFMVFLFLFYPLDIINSIMNARKDKLKLIEVRQNVFPMP